MEGKLRGGVSRGGSSILPSSCCHLKRVEAGVSVWHELCRPSNSFLICRISYVECGSFFRLLRYFFKLFFQLFLF